MNDDDYYNMDSDESSIFSGTTSSEDEDSDSSDEEYIALLNAVLHIPVGYKKRKLVGREDIMQKYSEEEFEFRFRLPKTMVLELVNRIYGNADNITSTKATKNALKSLEKVLITLRYYATSCFQIVNSDLFSVDQSTVSRIVREVSEKIAALAKQDIKMPVENEEINRTKTKFYNMHGIPNVIGVIDGTHIPIQSPGGNKAESFRNRKGWFSINVQIVCDSDMHILDIVARWPGSSHDQMILNFSKLQAELECGKYGHSYLLGDSGYACKKYMITPLSNSRTTSEINFNCALVSTRQIVERTIGVWKRRFPVLGTKSRTNVSTTLTVIVATAVLHNMLKNRDVPPPEIEAEIVNEVGVNDPQTRTSSVVASDTKERNFIIENFFQN